MNDSPSATQEIDAPEKNRIREAIAQRRTFAIISHPDAGKTTLTEKLLLYAGAIETAGMIKGRKKNSRATASDWLAIERERGISVTTSAMQVPYKSAIVTILDTPGHDDFCEDTYRALIAADSVVMVIDAGKGVEAQTRKLFAVCRRSGIPVMTFVNKLDLPAREPLELIAHIEDALGIAATPMNWPIGAGRTFKGVIDRTTSELVLYDAGRGSSRRTESRLPWGSPEARAALEPEVCRQLDEELELLNIAGNPFDLQAFLAGTQTPLFFGSALTNFGVEDFFDAFVELAPPPSARLADRADGTGERLIDPVSAGFSAFVFKIQANMNPRHRDSMAFFRICSGRFERDMVVKHHRTGRTIRLARSYATLARERATVDEAFPGDVLGVVNPGVFVIGDTVSVEGGFDYRPLPQLAPNLLCRIRPREVTSRKAFDKGLDQLVQEGTVQAIEIVGVQRERCVAAIGHLQFEVLQHRLLNEFGVATAITVETFNCGAWIDRLPETFSSYYGVLAIDSRGRALAFFRSEFEMRHARQQYPTLKFSDCS